MLAGSKLVLVDVHLWHAVDAKSVDIVSAHDIGRGHIVGTLIGALIIGTLNNGLNILDVSSFYQQVVKGIVILLAVLADRKKA